MIKTEPGDPAAESSGQLLVLRAIRPSVKCRRCSDCRSAACLQRSAPMRMRLVHSPRKRRPRARGRVGP